MDKKFKLGMVVNGINSFGSHHGRIKKIRNTDYGLQYRVGENWYKESELSVNWLCIIESLGNSGIYEFKKPFSVVVNGKKVKATYLEYGEGRFFEEPIIGGHNWWECLFDLRKNTHERLYWHIISETFI